MSIPQMMIPNMEKLLVMRDRMAARKQRIAQALYFSLDDCRPLKKQRLTRKTVRFNEEKNTVQFRYASAEDLQNAWLQSKDYKSIRDENRETLLAITNVKGNIHALNANEFCIRGLEEQISVYIFRTAREKQRKFSKLVFVQHKIQQKHGLSDPDTLRKISDKLSQVDRTKAIKIAIIDAIR
jgi:hypothetical protein